MSGFLFEQIIFGPIKSRRLGISLGVNLLPTVRKHCTFNCIYCECGWTQTHEIEKGFPVATQIKEALEEKLAGMKKKNALLDSITFAGNGEPTIHPEFPQIVDFTIELRDKYYPDAMVSVLTNASKASDPSIAMALLKTDQPILKLDAGRDETFQTINNPGIDVSLGQILSSLEAFKGKAIIQTLFVKGIHKGRVIDNSTDEEVDAWLEHLKKIEPRLVMIYPIARSTPEETLEKVPFERLMEIARKVEALGFEAEVY
ncbi:MAG: radical SAM protein [Bacteroidetes bacterium]|nr:MAG: radical SAM protein [Bacteroidota bacterium]